MKQSKANPNSMRNYKIRVFCNSDDKQIIQQTAKNHNLSVSKFLRELGASYTATGSIDRELFADLFKLCAEQAKLGNQLKSWLNEEPEQRFSPAGDNTIKTIVNELAVIQNKINAEI